MRSDRPAGGNLTVGRGRRVARKTTAARDNGQQEPSASTLARIRERELELDGLVLVARSEAEKLLSRTVAEAEASLREAETEAERVMAQSETAAIEAAQREAAAIAQSTTEEIERLRQMAQSRRRATVEQLVRITVGD